MDITVRPATSTVGERKKTQVNITATNVSAAPANRQCQASSVQFRRVLKRSQNTKITR